MFKKEWERAMTIPKTLDLKPPYQTRWLLNNFLQSTRCPSFRSLISKKEPLNSMCPDYSILWDNVQVMQSYVSGNFLSLWLIDPIPGTSISNQDKSKTGSTWSLPSTRSSFLLKLNTLWSNWAEPNSIQARTWIFMSKGSHEKAFDCVDSVNEEVMVYVCLHGMNNEYRIFLENLMLSFFCKANGSG